ncbi:MAG: ABC transporter ATP-binding protein [Acidimicrobiales bacterium]
MGPDASLRASPSADDGHRRAGEVAVEVDSLTVRFGHLEAVAGASFQAAYGEVLAVLGPNGAGKTTTIEALEGYRRPSAGRLRVAGLDPFTRRRELARRVGVVLQRGGVYPMMSAERVLALFASYYDDARRPGELLERLDLRRVAKTAYKRLSGGEQQRLALALALVGKPQILFLDEPTAGVDPGGRIAVRDVLAGLRRDGICVVLTSHELDEVERLADRVVMLTRGKVAAAGRPSEIAGPPESIRFVTAPGIDAQSLGVVMGAEVTEGPGGRYVIGRQPSPGVLSQLAAWLAERDLVLEELDAGRERLEDVFLRLSREE